MSVYFAYKQDASKVSKKVIVDKKVWCCSQSGKQHTETMGLPCETKTMKWQTTLGDAAINHVSQSSKHLADCKSFSLRS